MLTFRVTGVLILCLSLRVEAELSVGFTEVIFQGRESEPCLNVWITREGPLSRDLKVNVHPLTYQRFLESGFLLPDIPQLQELPNPAENEPERKDFIAEVQTITLLSDLDHEDHLVCIALNPDMISETNEGFFVVLSVNENENDEIFQENQVALAVILDDDAVEVAFEQLSYMCNEGEPENSCTVCVALGNAATLEKDLEISLIALTHSSTAKVSEDYVDASHKLVLSSSHRRACLTIHILDDDLAETDEGFTCVLSQTDPQSLPSVHLERGVTSITIQDNDVVSVGFDQDVYSCRVGQKERCKVCVSVLSSTYLEPAVTISLYLASVSKTALAGLDFEGINERLTLSAAHPSVCVPVQTVNTGRAQDGRNLYFECILLRNVQPTSFSNVVLGRGTTTVQIKGHQDGGRCLGVGGRSVCHEKAICHDEVEGGVLCECLEGYRGDGYSSCTDVDECKEGLDDCSREVSCHFTSAGREVCRPLALCVNTHGSYQCTCSTGYTGDGTHCTAIEDPVNECRQGTHNCHTNAHCRDTPNGFLCQCIRGFTGDGVECTDVNECKSGIHCCDTTKFCHYSYVTSRVECVHTAECVNTCGGYECSCRHGFTGHGTNCIDVDECQGPTECDASADCLNIPSGYHCQCREGFVGDGTLCTATGVAGSGSGCSLEPTVCSPAAVCEEIEGISLCICNPGFEGDGHTCTDMDECARPGEWGECGLDAVCENTPGSFMCVCREGFVQDGDNCTRVLVDECALGTDDCSEENSVCIDKEEGYSCACRSGYRDNGSSQCIDIDECSEGVDECSSNGGCRNTQGGYECYCLPGYDGDGFICTDTDECLQDLKSCSEQADCTNTVGSYQCECLTGFDGDGKTCTDIDECTEGLDNCDVNADCVNTEGSFLCSCHVGYEGDGRTCIDVDECSEGVDECSSDGGCLNTEGDYKCYCLPGYEGDGFICTDVDECAGDPCGSNADCTNTPGSFLCTCHTGYQGDGTTCTDINECAEETDSCGRRKVCQDGSCRRVGQCTNTRGSFQCSCSPGFTGNGHSCLDVDECKRQLHNCHTRALCTNTIGGFHCVCRSGFIGSGTACLPASSASHSPCDTSKGYANWLKCQEEGQYHTQKDGTKTLLASDKSSQSLTSPSSVEIEQQQGPSHRGNDVADSPSRETQKPSHPAQSHNSHPLSTGQSVGDSRGKEIHRSPKYKTKLRVWQQLPGHGGGRGYGERGSSHGYFLTNPWQGDGKESSDHQNRVLETDAVAPAVAGDYQRMLDTWLEDGVNKQTNDKPTTTPSTQKETHPLHSDHYTTNRNSHHNHNPHSSSSSHARAHTHHRNLKTGESIQQQSRRPHPLAKRPSSKPPQPPRGQRRPAIIAHPDPNTADNDVWFRVPGDVSIQLSQH